MNYTDIYSKRLNRYGYDLQSRLQKQREREFENKLLKSVYRVEFYYNNDLQVGTLEPYKQDETLLIQHLLTRVELSIPNGTILMIPDKDNIDEPWMIYWLESMRASGYNRYIVLKMTHYLKWLDENGESRESWAYMHGKQSGALLETIQGARSGKKSIYMEDDNYNFFVMPRNIYIKKDTYIEIEDEDFKDAFIVTGYDIQSVKGVEFVTIDPVFVRDKTPAPEKQPEESSDDYFWLTGGAE